MWPQKQDGEEMVLSMKVLLKCGKTASLHAKFCMATQKEHEAFHFGSLRLVWLLSTHVVLCIDTEWRFVH